MTSNNHKWAAQLEYDDGQKARSNGIPFNERKSRDWQRGWRDKDEQLAELLRSLCR